MTTTLRDLGIPGLLGVLIGWGLNQLSAGRARRDQRLWDEETVLRQQQRHAIATIDEALADASAAADLPTGGNPISFSALALASREFRQAWNRYEPRIYQEELRARLLGTEDFFRLAARIAPSTDASSTELAIAAELAIANARQAIAAVLHDREFEPPVFPSGYWSADREVGEDKVQYLTHWFDDHATDNPVLLVRYVIVHGENPPGLDDHGDYGDSPEQPA